MKHSTRGLCCHTRDYVYCKNSYWQEAGKNLNNLKKQTKSNVTQDITGDTYDNFKGYQTRYWTKKIDMWHTAILVLNDYGLLLSNIYFFIYFYFYFHNRLLINIYENYSLRPLILFINLLLSISFKYWWVLIKSAVWIPNINQFIRKPFPRPS